MNYRHAFHAGSFADVVKHAVLACVVAHLRAKQSAFRLIDTHAGSGLTRLTGPEASRTGEWRQGIGRLLAANLEPDIRALLAPYLDAIAGYNADGRLRAYPGSPLLALAWLRPQDRLIACELVPAAAAALARSLGKDRRAKVIAIDGWTALAAYVPPRERRGIVLIDPPFEAPGEFERLAEQLAAAHRKWATGIYLLWYPIKEIAETERFARRVAMLGVPKILRAEVRVAVRQDKSLIGSGLLLVNPPWKLETELQSLLPALATVLGRDREGAARLDWLTAEK
ncbi:MAG TPA: 23S rRNA (adenine(2030)-N(6))-methyltransferase RlmJ [Xanthobacteraceae bacterium]